MASEDASSSVPDILATMPTRILVQTTTNLVPGKDYSEKLFGMWDRICQYHWGCDFEPSADDFRWAIYGTKFAYPNRRCYFLMDRGFVHNGEQLRLLWYNWTGSTLQLIDRRLPDDIRAKLDSFPFNSLMPERPAHSLPGRTPERMHKRILKKIQSEWPITQEEWTVLAQHPETVAWVKNHLEPFLWPKLEIPSTAVLEV